MLARCGAAGCVFLLFATFLFARFAIGHETAHIVLVAGSYALLGLSAIVFLAGEVAHMTRKSRHDTGPLCARERRLAPAPTDDVMATRSPTAVDDLVGMLDNTLKLASAVPAGYMEPIDVTDLLGELAGRQKNARLNVTLRPRSLHTLASRPALARALEILVENALSNGLRVSVSCDRGASAAVVHVDDDGPGVPQSERMHIFEWQYYISTPPSAHKGWRVELAIARQIMRSHGGDIVVGASPLGGARFTARMPLLGEHEIELAAAS
jgi:signal transduction histidine kinase